MGTSSARATSWLRIVLSTDSESPSILTSKPAERRNHIKIDPGTVLIYQGTLSDERIIILTKL
jgi:hypothetical protein